MCVIRKRLCVCDKKETVCVYACDKDRKKERLPNKRTGKQRERKTDRNEFVCVCMCVCVCVGERETETVCERERKREILCV